MTPSRDTDTRAMLVILGALTAASFAISAGSLTEFAEECHMAFPWLFPVMLDGGIIGISYAAFRAAVSHRPSGWYMTQVVAFTLVSVFFNVAHVWHSDILTRVTHGTPPVVTFAVFEVLLRELRADRAKRVAPPVPSPTPAAPRVTRAKRVKPGAGETMADRAKRMGVSLRTLYRRQGRV